MPYHYHQLLRQDIQDLLGIKPGTEEALNIPEDELLTKMSALGYDFVCFNPTKMIQVKIKGKWIGPEYYFIFRNKPEPCQHPNAVAPPDGGQIICPDCKMSIAFVAVPGPPKEELEEEKQPDLDEFRW